MIEISWDLVLAPVEDIHLYYPSTKEHVSIYLDDDILNAVVESVMVFLSKSKDISNLEDDVISVSDSDVEANSNILRDGEVESILDDASNSNMGLSDTDVVVEKDTWAKTPATPDSDFDDEKDARAKTPKISSATLNIYDSDVDDEKDTRAKTPKTSSATLNIYDSDVDDEKDTRAKTPKTSSANNNPKINSGSSRDKSGRASKPPDLLTYTESTSSKKYSIQQAVERWKKALAEYEKFTGEKYTRRKGDRIDHFEILIANLRLEFEAKKKRENDEKIAPKKKQTKSYAESASENTTIGYIAAAPADVAAAKPTQITSSQVSVDGDAKVATKTIHNMIDYLASIETKIVAKNKQIFQEQRELDISRRDVAPINQETTMEIKKVEITKVDSSTSSSCEVVSSSQQQSTYSSSFETSDAYARAKYDYEHRNSYNSQQTSENRHYGMRQLYEYDDRREIFNYRPRPSYYDDRDQQFLQRSYHELFPQENYQIYPRPYPQQYPAYQPHYSHQRTTPQQYSSQEHSQRPPTHPQGSGQRQYQQEPPWQRQTPQQPHHTNQQTPQPPQHSHQQQTPQQKLTPLQTPQSNQQQTPQQNPLPLQSQHPTQHQTPIPLHYYQHSQTYDRVDRYEFESRRSGPEFEHRRERGNGFEPMVSERSGHDFAGQWTNYCASEHAPEEEYFEPIVRQARDAYYQNPSRDGYHQNNLSHDHAYYQNSNNN